MILSRLDLTNPLVSADAQHELRAALDHQSLNAGRSNKLAAWADKWGESVLEILHDLPPLDDGHCDLYAH